MLDPLMKPPRPWYKEPWPWILFGLPLISVIVGLAFLSAAIVSDDGMVTDDYYKQGKAINMELRRDQAAAEMGLSAQVLIAQNGRSIRVLTASKVVLPESIELHFSHPSQDDFDLQVTLQRSGNHLYQGVLPTMLALADHWYLQLADKSKKWRLQGTWRPAEGQELELIPPDLSPVEG
ncbi:FixH family protein [Neisseriaceae bacterium TC5R-5]|nr:FixH family protein [Neisseriaceae bacterium TC5R-5]